MSERKKKEYKPQPSVKGVMNCDKGHRWDVVDLNLELKTTFCPVCGVLTSISGGLERNG